MSNWLPRSVSSLGGYALHHFKGFHWPIPPVVVMKGQMHRLLTNLLAVCSPQNVYPHVAGGGTGSYSEVSLGADHRPNRIAEEKDGDLHDLNSCTRKTPGELQTRAKLGKYLPSPTTENARAVDNCIWRSSITVGSWTATPQTQPRSSPRCGQV